MTRRIWLCADDYGMAPGVNDAIRQLVLQGRLNATSVMMSAPAIGAEEVDALEILNSGETRVAIGLHVTLTAPFKPLSNAFKPLRHGAFLSINEMMRRAMTRKLDVDALTIEIATQLQAFLSAFGRLPDFVDGHQHVHLLPQVRNAFIKVVSEIAPTAWVRQCGRVRAGRASHDAKSLVLDVLSLGFKSQAARHGLATNPAFAGAYAFTPKARFARIFPRFLKGLPDGGLIMCHPGFVDKVLESLDPLTTLREHEFAFFSSDAFPRMLAEHGAELANPSGGAVGVA